VGNPLAFKILSGGLRSYSNNFRFFLRVALPWLAICLPVYWFGMDYLLAHPQLEQDENLDLKSALFEVLMPLVLSVAFASIAVSWHRHILIGGDLDRVPWLMLDRAVWRYWWNGMAIFLFAVLVALPVAFVIFWIGGLISTFEVVIDIIGFIALFAIIFQILYRLSIKLPAIAIGKQSYSYKESWKDTKGKTLQFVILGTIVAFLGKFVSSIEKATVLSLPKIDSFLGHYGLISVEPLLQLIFSGLVISMLTYTYAYFAEDREL
jgi:hypothetical protein